VWWLGLGGSGRHCVVAGRGGLWFSGGMKTRVKWVLLTVVVLLAILVPFGIWGEQIDHAVERYLVAVRERPMQAAFVLSALLAGDIVLPTPSSLISTACGTICGFLPGMLASWVGMNMACLLGYLMGRFASGTRVRRMMGESSMATLERISARRGSWFLIVTRPVPVLAEAAVLFAGLGQMPAASFIRMSFSANLGISIVYAWVGATATDASGFLWAFLLAMGLPGLLMLAHHTLRR
jgi:uncharacterized membrane protein YdjX (TVP38/TMEM64 family)